MNVKHIERYLGIFLLINGIVSFIPASIAYIYNEPILPHLISAVLSCVCGMFFIRSPREELGFGDAMLLTASSLLGISFFGAIPFFMTLEGSPVDKLVNGYFESVSGYTTTGLTILEDELRPDSSSYLHSTIFRRTLSEWIGGLGIVVLFLSILARGGISTVYLYKMGIGVNRITPSVEHTAKIILKVYLFYTLMGIIFLWLVNGDTFYSITSTMSTLATGGFIFMDHGFNADFPTHLILSSYMLIGAIPFTLHYVLFSGCWRKFFRNIEIRTLCWIMAISFLLITVVSWNIIPQQGISFLKQFPMVIIPTITTTGNTGFGLELMGDVGKFIIIILTIVGAGAGSTGGGLKLIRFAVLTKAIHWLTVRSSLPDSAVFPLKLNKRVFSNKELRIISLFFFIYIVLICTGMLIVLAFGTGSDGGSVEPIDALLLSASAQSTSSITNLDIGSQPAIVKIFLIFQMIAGRVEIFPVLALIGYLANAARTDAIILEHEAVGVENRVINDVEDEIYRMNKWVNRYERKVRDRIGR